MVDFITGAKHHRNIIVSELIRRRTKAGLSQQELADLLADKLGRVSLHRTYIVQLERLKENPDIPTQTAQALEEILPPAS